MMQPTPLQTTYAQYAPPGQVGVPADSTLYNEIDMIAEDPLAATIPFGRAICQGLASDKAGTLGQLSGTVFIGLSRANITLPLDGRTVDTYANTDNMKVMIQGDMWVAPDGTVAAGGAVYYNSVTGQLGPSGISNAVQIHNARWVTSSPNTDKPMISFGGLAIVRLGASASY